MHALYKSISTQTLLMDSDYLHRALSAVTQGDHEAFGRLFDLFYGRVYRFSSFFLSSREDCEEVVSEVFRIIWQNKHLLIGINNFESYMYVITRNESYKLLKANKRLRNVSIDEMPVELHLSDQSVENGLIDQEMMEVYRRAVNELPERCKLIFLMVREEKMRYREVAEILSLSEGTIEQQINIATKRIVKVVTQMLPSLKIKR